MFPLCELRDLEGAVRSVVADLEPEDVPVAYAARVFERFATIERLAASAKTLVARRVEEAGPYRNQGCRSTAEQLAKIAGTSNSAAKRMLDTSKQVAEQPAVSDAMRNGELSAPAAEEVANAAAVVPDQAERLVETAKTSTFSDLHKACLEARATGDRDADHERIKAERYARTWLDGEGGWNLRARGTAEQGAKFQNAIEPIVNEIFKNARKNDEQEPREAYAFDALIKAVTEEPAGPSDKPARSKSRYTAIVRLDYDALVRGYVDGEEICEIAGLGPIPVRVARDLLGESVVKLVITKGVDVINVTHLGRQATAAQRVALWWRDPICARDGCGQVWRLQIDHRDDWALTHHTRFDELDHLCPPDHDLKTRLGWALVEGTGRRPMVPPDDPRHPKNKPKPNL